MFGLLSALGGASSLISAGVELIGGITKEIAAERTRQATLKSDQEIQASKERIASLEAERDVQREMVKHEVVAIIRAITASFYHAIVIIFLGKVIIIDKVFKLGSTDDLSANLWTAVFMIMGGLFLHGALQQLRRR